jgi:biotin carboxylase
MESVIIVGAGIMQIPAILTAKEMGFNVIATDMNPNAEGFKFADIKICLNTKDIDGHVKFAIENKEKYNIVGAFAGADVARTVSAITNKLGLPGVSEETALISNNKWLMKQRWIKDNVPTPYSIEVKTIEEAIKQVDKVGLPCMMKAIDNAASRGTKKIYSMEEVESAFKDACRNSTTNSALVEEFVEGEEQSVETIIYEGKQYRFGIVDRHYDMKPLPIETGHTNPSKLSESIQEEIYNVVKCASDSLGITWGPAKADMILTKKGPMILEMPARLSGGFHSQYTTPISSGMDPIKFTLALCTGRGLDLESYKRKKDYVAQCKAIFPKPGVIQSITGIKEALDIDGVDHIFMVVKEGDIIEDYKNCADRPCYVIVHGKDYKEADEKFRLAKECIKIKTT